jgi:two-component system sensor histidine kinase HydH
MEKDGKLSIRDSLTGDNLIVIEIRDTGPGIRAENLNKIFDPYYTTKTKGTGLGLAIVHKIIDAHNGDIRVRSVPGQGTAFIISLPAKKI